MNTLKINPLLQPIAAEISIPGSKSYTNRALIMAALTKGPVKILNPLYSDDTEAMVNCLKTLGIKIDVTTDSILVHGDIYDIKDQIYNLDVNLSGTTVRFITALAAVVPGKKIIFGKESLNKRPLGELVEGLKQLGVKIQYKNVEGCPPIQINNFIDITTPKTVKMNGDISSQYFTALLMIAPAIGGITIEVIGNQISKSYIDMTIDMMNSWGVRVNNDNYKKYVVESDQKYSMTEYIVEGDYSGAGYFVAIAALTQSTLTLKNLNPESKQGDLHFAEILKTMGNEIVKGNNEITIIGHGVKPITVDMEQCPDQAQTLAVLAAFADGKSTLTGIRSLRVKETERVKATQNELAKMGIKTESPDNDTLIIYGGNPKPATIDTYHDHRMAMSFAVAGTKMNGITINDPEVVTKTFPTFWNKLKELGIKIS